MSELALPAYFIGGPKEGETLNFTGNPWSVRFPVPYVMPMPWELPRDVSLLDVMPNMETDRYDRVRPVVLYRYAGRY